MTTREDIHAILAGAPAGVLTANKVSHLIERGGVITGFAVRMPEGGTAVIDRSACRWLNKDTWWELFHGVQFVPERGPVPETGQEHEG